MFMILFCSSQNAPCGFAVQGSLLTGTSFGCPHSVQSLTTALVMWLRQSQSQIKGFLFLTITHPTNHLRLKCLVLTDPISQHTQDFVYTSTISFSHICFSYVIVQVMQCPAKGAQLRVSGGWSVAQTLLYTHWESNMDTLLLTKLWTLFRFH